MHRGKLQLASLTSLSEVAANVLVESRVDSLTVFFDEGNSTPTLAATHHKFRSLTGLSLHSSQFPSITMKPTRIISTPSDPLTGQRFKWKMPRHSPCPASRRIWAAEAAAQVFVVP